MIKIFVKRVALFIVSTGMVIQPLQAINFAPRRSHPTANHFVTLAICNELSHAAANKVGGWAYRGYYYIKNKLTPKPTTTQPIRPKTTPKPSIAPVLVPILVAQAAKSLTQIYLNMKIDNYWGKKFEGRSALPFSYYALLYGADSVFSTLYNYAFNKTLDNASQLEQKPTVKTGASTLLSGLSAVGALYTQYQAPIFINKYFYNIVMPPARFALHCALTALRSLRDRALI